ncbi:MAG: DUF4926 domain-containing protein [Desertifilum sp. SIO1I2]|nr:DUF4926 domain-containing protein [Desertifilum sp. SIO1I2]
MKLLDGVALLEDLRELKLYRGQVGTIVEVYEPGVFEVEFSDLNGRAYAIETLKANQLMVLHHRKSSRVRRSIKIPKHRRRDCYSLSRAVPLRQSSGSKRKQ